MTSFDPAETNQFLNACIHNDRDGALHALQSGADPCGVDRFGRCGLSFACHYGHLFMAEELIAWCPDRVLECVDLFGYTVLHTAVYRGNDDIFGLIASRLAHVGKDLLRKMLEIPEKETQSLPVHTAAQQGHVGILGKLLAMGCRIEVANQNGETPLHLAVLNRRSAAIERLLSSHAHLATMEDDDGWTPVLAAVHLGDLDALQRMSAHGVDLKQVHSRTKKSTLDYAIERNHTHLIPFLSNLF